MPEGKKEDNAKAKNVAEVSFRPDCFVCLVLLQLFEPQADKPAPPIGDPGGGEQLSSDPPHARTASSSFTLNEPKMIKMIVLWFVKSINTHYYFTLKGSVRCCTPSSPSSLVLHTNTLGHGEVKTCGKLTLHPGDLNSIYFGFSP